MPTRPISPSELKIAIQDLLTNDPDTFFAILRDVRDDMETEGLLDHQPTPGDRVRAEVETELAALADFFRGFA